MKKILVLVATLFVLLTKPVFAEEPITLKFACFEPPQAYITTQIFVPWVDKVNKDGQGILKIEMYAGGALGRNPGTQLKLLLDGVADLAWILNPYTPGRFPDDQVVDIPAQADNLQGGVALQRLYDRGMLRGYDDLVVIGHTTAWQYYVHSSYPIRTPEDMKGRKFKITGQTQHALMKAVGGAPVGMSITEVAEAISRGVIDGLVGEPNSMNTFKVYEVARYHLENVSFGTSNQMIAMTKKKYESLPSNARAILDKNRGETFARYYGEKQTLHNLQILEKYSKDSKHNFYTPTAEEAAKWESLMKPVVDNWRKEHPNGENLYNSYMGEIKKIKGKK